MIRVFIGYDPRQPIAAQVLAHSLAVNCTKPVAITRLHLPQLPIKRVGLTAFTYSRFLVPWLCDYEGYGVFIDSDFLARGDVSDLVAEVLLDDLTKRPGAAAGAAVWVSKNKLRFEWPSLMVFNAALCRVLTPEFVDDSNNALFDFAWAGEVRDLRPEWNHLVGYDAPRSDAKMVHFTQGIPCWPETRECEFAEEWRRMAKNAASSVSFEDLMGKSVHAEPVRKRLQRGA